MDRRTFGTLTTCSALTALTAGCIASVKPETKARRRVVWHGSGKRVVGYVTSWSQRRAYPCQFDIDQIDASLFTHLVYAYARIRTYGSSRSPQFEIAPAEIQPKPEATMRARSPRWKDMRGDMGQDGQYEHLNRLKYRHPHLKTLLAIGGRHPNEEPLDWSFSLLAENPASRQRFVQHAVALLRAFRFDGLSLDWAETEAQPWRKGDARNFLALCRQFKEVAAREAASTDKPELLLTMAAGPQKAGALDIERLWPYLDWINLTAYDYHHAERSRTHPLAPLQGIQRATPEDVARSTAAYLERGVPPERLTLGMPTYARGWRGVAQVEPHGSARGGAPEGQCTKFEGVISHNRMKDLLESGRFATYWDDATQTPYAYDARRGIWYSYDDERSFGYKVDFIERQNLGGAMLYAIDLDDFQNGYPLTTSVAKRLRRG